MPSPHLSQEDYKKLKELFEAYNSDICLNFGELVLEVTPKTRNGAKSTSDCCKKAIDFGTIRVVMPKKFNNLSCHLQSFKEFNDSFKQKLAELATTNSQLETAENELNKFLDRVKKRRASQLTVEPPKCKISAAGGTSTHKLVNAGGDTIVFKTKSSNNNAYRINFVYGFIEPRGFKIVNVLRIAGPPQEDTIYIEFGKASSNATDARAAFDAITPAETFPIPLSATA